MLCCLLAAICAVSMVAGCGKEKKEPQRAPVVEKPKEEPPIVEEPVDPHAGMAKSYLSGEWINEAVAKKRPLAVMIGNTSDALPQYGLSSADIIYEVPVEGSYTRLMAIFQDYTGLDKIGSIRSCRHYFVYFAKEFDAIYTHYGQSIYAVPVLERDDVNNLSGMDSSIESLMFYRDTSRKAPHNAFISADGINAGIAKKEYRTELLDTYQGHYLFAEDNAPVELTTGENAVVVSPGYFVNKPWFVYNATDGLYYRYEFKDKQIDGATQGQLAVKNVIVQYCDWSNKDENGYLDINTTSGGDGIYITNGKMEPVTWTKANEDSPARYFDASGKEITINQGKTWVCVVRKNYKDRFHVYDTEDALAQARTTE